MVFARFGDLPGEHSTNHSGCLLPPWVLQNPQQESFQNYEKPLFWRREYQLPPQRGVGTVVRDPPELGVSAYMHTYRRIYAIVPLGMLSVYYYLHCVMCICMCTCRCIWIHICVCICTCSRTCICICMLHLVLCMSM